MQKFKEGQDVFISTLLLCKYQSISSSGLKHIVLLDGEKMSISDKDIYEHYTPNYPPPFTPPTEPDTELSDILQTAKSPKRDFVERVAPAFFQAMVSDPKENVAYIETAVEKAAKMWDYIQSLNY